MMCFMKSLNNSIKSLFKSGAIQRVYKQFLKNDYEKSEITWLIGALCFLGKWEEVLTLIKKRKLQSSESFFMLTACVRRGDYVFAKKLMRELSKQSRINEEAQFFYYQALAFYAYYKCRYKMALYFVLKGYSASFNLSESFWKILSLDLLGHACVQMGDIHKGIYYLEEASALAALDENKTFQEATRISILNYQTQFTRKPKEMIVTLEKTLKNISRSDNYSEGSLLLSLAHLFLLTGQMGQAERTLLRAQSVIFASSAPRHIAQWYFEHAYFYYLAGRNELALNDLAQAQEHCHEENEKKLVLKILGLKRKIFYGLKKDTSALDEKILKLTMLLGDSKGRNHLARLGFLANENSEDPLQVLFDSWESLHWQNSLSLMIESGYFGMLREKVTNKLDSYIVTGLWKKGVLILTPHSTYMTSKGASALLLKALQLLTTRSSVSKEELVEHIWGYHYDPLRHDTLLYALIHRLRLLLGPYEKELIGENHSYFLNHHFEWLELSLRENERPLGSQLSESKEANKSWNIRQHKVLSFIQNGENFKVSDYALRFNVSLMTALRDLSELVDDKKIKKYGRARGTTYGA